MATPAQIQANRRNSQKSTGPSSAEGKAVSRFNALKTGIHAKAQVIPGEDASELEALIAEYHQQFQPSCPLERFLVDAVVTADWQLRRLRKVEAQLWEWELEHVEERSGDSLLAQVYSEGSDVFARLYRRIDATERSYYRAIKQLQRVQPVPQDSPEDTLPSEIEPPASLSDPAPAPGYVVPQLASLFRNPALAPIRDSVPDSPPHLGALAAR